MSLDQATLLRVTTQDTIMGLRQERGAFADMVCTKFSKAALTGSEPLFASAQTMAQRQGGGQAVGTTMRDKNIKLASADWDMLEFSEKFRIAKAHLTDMDQYMDTSGEAIAAGAIAKGVKVCATAAGQVKTAASGDLVFGYTREAAGAQGDIIEIVIEKNSVVLA